MIPTKEALVKAIEDSKLQPSKEIRKILQQAIIDEIKKYKLPYEIRDEILFDLSETVDAYLDRFISVTVSILQIKEDIRKLAKEYSPVLLYGETGTGKELLARALHGEKKGDFYGINCAGLPEELVESELFGHKQGSFTGAMKDKEGLMKLANEGTLFLDEIGELPLLAQAKLLRAIQERKIRKVGGDRNEDINCRIVCASNRNIKDMCDAGKFRIDLYARISTFEINIPPLIERMPEDVELIIKSLKGGADFIAAMEQSNKKLVDLDLSLNVRSLQKHVERFRVLGKLPK